jgi:diguanylate cyclase (GGDEF)-like protein/PAS domain S-box-containing protein
VGSLALVVVSTEPALARLTRAGRDGGADGLATAVVDPGDERLVEVVGRADAAVVDLGDPSGWDVLVRLGSAVPDVVLLTIGEADPVQSAAAIDAGADAHLWRASLGLGELHRAVLDAVRRRARSAARDDELTRLRTVVEHSNDVTLCFAEDGTIEWVGPNSARVLGLGAGDLVGRNGFELVHPEDRPGLLAAFDALAWDGDARTVEFRALDPEGRLRWFSETVVDRRTDPALGCIVANLRDVTDRRDAEASLRFHSRVLGAIGEAVAATDEDGRLTYLNPAAEQLYGWPLEDALGLDGGELSVAEPGVDGAELLARQIRRGVPWAGNMWLKRRDGSRFHGHVTNTPLLDEHGRCVGLIGVTTDLTEQLELVRAAEEDRRDLAAARERLAHEALHDPLTGLANRAALTRRLEEALEAQRRGGPPVTVAFCDLDRFKVINDGLGHGTGDRVLLEVARRLAGSLPPGGSVARFGGDEFVVLRPGGADVASELAQVEDLLDCLDEPIEVDGRQFFVHASAGVTVSSPDDTPAGLLQAADAAMYEAKRARDRRAVFFDERLRSRSAWALEVESELRQALAADQLRVAYQPVVRVADGRCVGLESLVRWTHPRLGEVSPSSFIPVAEDCGLIVPIGALVLDRAVSMLAGQQRVPGREHLWVSVNLSAPQLADVELVGTVEAALRRCDVRPDRLHLEVTESVLMDRVEGSLETLEALRRLGVVLSVDDFGTGYSSLSYLKRLPIQTLKIDRSFIDGLGADPHDTSIVRAIGALANALSLDLVAEGVETEQQRAALEELGCELAQGYLWAPAMPEDELSDWLGSAAQRGAGRTRSGPPRPP